MDTKVSKNSVYSPLFLGLRPACKTPRQSRTHVDKITAPIFAPPPFALSTSFNIISNIRSLAKVTASFLFILHYFLQDHRIYPVSCTNTSMIDIRPVSYTHLTLPTIYSV